LWGSLCKGSRRRTPRAIMSLPLGRFFTITREH
jgi:hypothetical protein